MKHNPTGWRWRLILWLLRGEPIEAVPLDLQRGIPATQRVLVRLGQPGALNTVERTEHWWDSEQGL
jgi:hypothetical protein